MNNAFISYSHAADRELSSAIQTALQKFAKPWYKLRNLNIFRDESSLSASPKLWNNIVKALDNSEYFIYLASPEAANSKWVQREVSYWLENRSLDKFLIVLTDGEIHWNERERTFDKALDNSIPEVLQRGFEQEPFYVDLREIKANNHFSLANPEFKRELVKLAAQLHGKEPKDMMGDEIRAFQRMKRIRFAVIVSLGGLLLFSVYKTFEAKAEAERAIKNEKRADSTAVEVSKERDKVERLLEISQKGRGVQYENKNAAEIIDLLQKEQDLPLNDLVKYNAVRTEVVGTDTFDYLIWVDIPSFRRDEVSEVRYLYECRGFRPESREYLGREPSTGFAIGYRGWGHCPQMRIEIVLISGRSVVRNFSMVDNLRTLRKV